MKKLFIATITSAAICGCSTIQPIVTQYVTPANVQLGVSTGVAAAVVEWPQAIPGVQAAANVICSDAGQTNLNPTLIIADIQKLDPSLNTPTDILIENGALDAYTLLWEAYGASAVTNAPLLQSYLQATCAGMNQGLGPNAALKFSLTPATNSWPIIHY